MVCLASEDGRSLTAREIAQATSVPEGYLAKVLGSLAGSGLVKSKRGPTGGYILGRPPHQMELIEVIRSVEPRRLAQASDENGLLTGLRERIVAASDAERAYFAGVTLAEVSLAREGASGG